MNESEDPPRAVSRRVLIKEAAAIAGVALTDPRTLRAAEPGALPWYRRAVRWGQANVTEIEAARHRLVAGALETDAPAGRGPLRRRDGGLLPDRGPVSPEGGVSRESRPVRGARTRSPQEEMAQLLRLYRAEKVRIQEALLRAGVPNAQLRGRSLREMRDLLWRGVTSAR